TNRALRRLVSKCDGKLPASECPILESFNDESFHDGNDHYRMNRPQLQELANSLFAAFPKLDDAQRHLGLATYRRLARGMAASPLEIASDAGIEIEKAQCILDDWIGAYHDEAKRVVGFSGLTNGEDEASLRCRRCAAVHLVRMGHAFPSRASGKSARVESLCEASGEPVRLSVYPKRIESVDPDSVCI